MMWVHTAGEVDFEEFLLLMDRKAKESRDDIENSGLLEAFKVFDKDGNGVITQGATLCLSLEHTEQNMRISHRALSLLYTVRSQMLGNTRSRISHRSPLATKAWLLVWTFDLEAPPPPPTHTQRSYGT